MREKLKIKILRKSNNGNILLKQAQRRIPMYMSDWIETLDGFLKLSNHEILIHAGKISARMAELKAKE